MSGLQMAMGLSLAPRGLSASASVTIGLRNNGAIAPNVVQYDLTFSGFNVPAEELDFIVSTTGSTDSTGTAPAVEALHGANTGQRFTDRGAFYYADTTEQTISVVATDGVNSATATATVQLVASSVPLANQIYVNNTGTINVQHGDAPAGAQYAVSLAQASDKAAITSGDVDIYVRAGQTFDENGFGDRFDGDRNVRIMTYGGSGRVTVNQQDPSAYEFGVEFFLGQGRVGYIDGFDFNGVYDPVNELGALGAIWLRFGDNYFDLTVANCSCENFGSGIEFVSNNPNGDALTTFWALSNVKVEGWGNYGFRAGVSPNLAMLDSAFLHDPLSGAGGSGSNNNSADNNQHGPLRLSNPIAGTLTTISRSQFFSVVSWPAIANATFTVNPQPCIRWNTSGGRIPYIGLAMDHCVTEGSTACNLGVPNAGDSSDRSPGDVTIRGHLHLFTASAQSQGFLIDMGGTKIVSCILVAPDVYVADYDAGSGPRASLPQFFVPDDDDTNPTFGTEQFSTPVRLISNTIMRLGTDAENDIGAGRVIENEVRNYFDAVYPLEYGNNVLFGNGPDTAAERTAMQPFTLTSPVTPLYLGYKDKFFQTTLKTVTVNENPGYAIATPPNTETVLTPGSASTLATPVNGEARARRDFFGAVHNGQGAVAAA